MKRVGLVLVGLSLVSLVFGQSELVTVSVGGGLHSLKHEPKLPTKNELGKCFGEGKLSAGATFSARYMHFFRDGNWGIGSGADVSYYAATSCLDGVETTSEYDKYNKEKFDCSFSFNGWEERQRVFALEIPLGVYFRTDFTYRLGMVAGLGAKLIMPLHSRFEIQEGSYELTGYYPEDNVTFSQLPHHGFYDNSPRYKDGIDTKPVLGVYAEYGLNIKFTEKLWGYAGVYFNYGITDMAKEHVSDLGAIRDDFQNGYKGVLNSSAVDKANFLAAGVKIGITLPFGKKPELPLDSTLLEEPLPMVPMVEPADSSAILDSTKAANIQIDPEDFRRAKDALGDINNTVHFKLGSARLNKSKTLNNGIQVVAQFMKKYPNVKLEVDGHTCTLGTEERNDKLGVARANSLIVPLIKAGCPKESIVTTSKSYHEPVASNVSETGRELNRRAVVKFIINK
jgi:Outer membrane protein and related peptidoglycan-associated (lipo)proteins